MLIMKLENMTYMNLKSLAVDLQSEVERCYTYRDSLRGKIMDMDKYYKVCEKAEELAQPIKEKLRLVNIRIKEIQSL